MTKFSSKAVVTVDELSVSDDTATDTCTESDIYEILHTLSHTILHLADGGSIGIIGNLCREACLLLDEPAQRNNAPPWQVGSIHDFACIVVGHRSTHTDTLELACTAMLFGKFLYYRSD